MVQLALSVACDRLREGLIFGKLHLSVKVEELLGQWAGSEALKLLDEELGFTLDRNVDAVFQYQFLDLIHEGRLMKLSFDLLHVAFACG